MGLVGFEVEQAWGSHQPVMKALLKVKQPSTVVECGSGEFSTPILREAVPFLSTIEHDQSWGRRMVRSCPDMPSHRWLIQGFPGAKNGTPEKDLPSGVMESFRLFYQDMAAEIEPIDVLFIDTFRCCRVLAAQTLSSKAQVVVLHDTEPQSTEWYRWDLLGDCFQGWHRASHRPPWQIQGRFPVPWTDIYSRDPLPWDEMNEIVAQESIRLWGGESRVEEVS